MPERISPHFCLGCSAFVAPSVSLRQSRSAFAPACQSFSEKNNLSQTFLRHIFLFKYLFPLLQRKCVDFSFPLPKKRYAFAMFIHQPNISQSPSCIFPVKVNQLPPPLVNLFLRKLSVRNYPQIQFFFSKISPLDLQ